MLDCILIFNRVKYYLEVPAIKFHPALECCAFDENKSLLIYMMPKPTTGKFMHALQMCACFGQERLPRLFILFLNHS